jgi:hypothetical protein
MSIPKAFASVVIVVFFVLNGTVALCQADPTPPLFELYSWLGQSRDPKSPRQWDFSILINTSAMKDASTIFASRTVAHGLDALGKRLDLLPPHSEVLWIEAIHEVKWQGNDTVRGQVAKGMERLALPPPEVVDRVREMVRSRGHRFVGVTGGDHTSIEE